MGWLIVCRGERRPLLSLRDMEVSREFKVVDDESILALYLLYDPLDFQKSVGKCERERSESNVSEEHGGLTRWLPWLGRSPQH